MVAIAKDYFESKLEFSEYAGVMRFDPQSIEFTSNLSTIAETSLYVVNHSWMFGTLAVSYPRSRFKNSQDLSECMKEFSFWIEDDRPRQGIATDLKIVENSSRWEIEIKFVNVSTMLV